MESAKRGEDEIHFRLFQAGLYTRRRALWATRTLPLFPLLGASLFGGLASTFVLAPAAVITSAAVGALIGVAAPALVLKFLVERRKLDLTATLAVVEAQLEMVLQTGRDLEEAVDAVVQVAEARDRWTPTTQLLAIGIIATRRPLTRRGFLRSCSRRASTRAETHSAQISLFVPLCRWILKGFL